MYYTSAAQLAALLPSNTPLGTGGPDRAYEGSTSASFTITIVANNTGSSPYRKRPGLAIATYPDYSLVSAVPGTGIAGRYLHRCRPGLPRHLRRRRASRRRDHAVGYRPGTGQRGDSASSLGQTVNIPLTLWIGGVSVAVSYQGRSGCCIGEDQIQFTVPSNVPTGCAVPVIIQIGTLVSNSSMLPIAASGRSCTPINPALTSSVVHALTTSTGPIFLANFELGRQLYSVNSSGSFYDDYGSASFGQITMTNPSTGQPTQPVVLSSFDTSPFGTCMAYSSTGTGNPVLVTSVAGADPGSITVSGPNGELPLTNHGGTPTSYGSVLSAQGTFFSGGQYTIAGSGGRDIGKFTTGFTIVATPTWQGPDQNRLITAGVTRASGFTINWVSGSAAYDVLITGTSYTDDTATIGASFFCVVPSTLNTFTVPPNVLLALPSGPYTEIDFRPALPPQNFTASGLDVGILNFNYQTSIFPQFN